MIRRQSDAISRRKVTQDVTKAPIKCRYLGVSLHNDRCREALYSCLEMQPIRLKTYIKAKAGCAGSCPVDFSGNCRADCVGKGSAGHARLRSAPGKHKEAWNTKVPGLLGLSIFATLAILSNFQSHTVRATSGPRKIPMFSAARPELPLVQPPRRGGTRHVSLPTADSLPIDGRPLRDRQSESGYSALYRKS